MNELDLIIDKLFEGEIPQNVSNENGIELKNRLVNELDDILIIAIDENWINVIKFLMEINFTVKYYHITNLINNPVLFWFLYKNSQLNNDELSKIIVTLIKNNKTDLLPAFVLETYFTDSNLLKEILIELKHAENDTISCVIDTLALMGIDEVNEYNGVDDDVNIKLTEIFSTAKSST